MDLKYYNKEYACSVSHYKVWQDILKNNYDKALIFEDDIHLVDNFVKKLDSNIVATFLRTATQNLIYGKPTGMQSYIINKNYIKDFNYGIDYQLCRLPLKILYTKERLSYQSKYN
jgi:GR25 family glycosyltransferase involved in LPS biosynthesis